jgi:hypothetical protein
VDDATRKAMHDEAGIKLGMADTAHRMGFSALRDSYLRQAADRYRAAGCSLAAAHCEGRIGR